MRPSATSGASRRSPVDDEGRGRATSVIRRAGGGARLTPVPDPRPDTEPPERGLSMGPQAAPNPGPAEPASAAPEPSSAPGRPATDPPPPISTIAPVSPRASEATRLAEPAEPSPTPPRVTPAKPLLASEALMEDLAPVEPARQDARTWCKACGAAFLLFGALPIAGLLPGSLGAGLPWLVTGAIAIFAGVVGITYRQRAVAMLVLGLLTGLVALHGTPTLIRADGGTGWGIARLFAAISLTAALVFRARYRAYAGARVFLGTALVISIPFIAHIVLVLTGDAGFGPAHLGAITVLVAITASLAGFMGAETTGAGSYMAPILVGAFAIELGSRGVATVGISGGLSPLVGIGVGAVGFGAAAGFTALGLFQILAWRFAADARRIDLHSPRRDGGDRASEHDPANDFPTRE